jgi:CDP-glucose 4,6-dehydratase
MESLVSALTAAYSGKRVLVTGHTGFKGSWMLGILHTLGAVVRGYALAPDHTPSLFDVIGEGLCGGGSLIADIRDRDRLKNAITEFKPDFIFHLAAQPLVRRSYHIPAETFDINVTGTANLLEGAAALEGVCTIVVVTTDKVYENPELDLPFREGDPLGGYDPYSTSKACAELVVDSFRKSFFSPAAWPTHQKALATARAGNVIGGGDWSEDRILPDIIRSLQRGETIPVRSPNAVRPWQHVLEPLVGYLRLGSLLALHPGDHSRAYNFGPLPDDHLTVGQLVDKAVRLYGMGRWEDVSVRDQHHEAGFLRLDISRALRDLQWTPRLSADEALEWTIAWYKQPRDNQRTFSFHQIKKYLSL